MHDSNKMSREYIQRIAKLLLANYKAESAEMPGYGPLERLFAAAQALDAVVNQGASCEREEFIDVLKQAKDYATAGEEMWLAGRIWLDHYSDTVS